MKGITMVRIRPCRASDFESLFRLLGQLQPDADLDRSRIQRTFNEAFNGQGRRQLCAVTAGRILGFCSISARSRLCRQESAAHIDEFLVDDRWRDMGIGTRLLDAAIGVAGELGCSHVELDSMPHCREAHRYYASRGFKGRACLFSKQIAPGRPGKMRPGKTGG